MKVLILAEAANPEWSSVPLVGWSHAKAISEITDSLIVTQIRNKEAFLKKGLVDGKDFIAIDSESVAKPIFKIGEFLSGPGKGWTTKMACSYFSYPFFERLIWKKLGKRIRAGEFDVVHRITPLSPALPSFIAKKCKQYDIPFVLGPLNGGLPWPKAFDKERRKEREWLSYVRNIFKIFPGYDSTRKNASAIIVGSKTTQKETEEKYHHKCFFMPENGIDMKIFSKKRERKARSKIKAVFVGRLVPCKGVDMLIEGFHEALKNNSIELAVVGDGPERKHIEGLAKKLGVSDNVTFHGWVAHAEVQNYLVGSDILAFPSIREFGGGVVLEAMALGVMPLIVNYGGPAELITPECAISVEMGDRKSIVEGLKQKAEYLVNNPAVIDAYGAEARRIVQEKFTWEKKAEKMISVYESVLGLNTDATIDLSLKMDS